MTPLVKGLCAISVLVLYVGVSCVHAAHPSAEKHVSDDRGSQGNQDLIKGNSTPPQKGDDDKIDDAKLKADTQKAREEFEKRNAKGQKHTGEKREDSR